jgi:hypothetical protein
MAVAEPCRASSFSNPQDAQGYTSWFYAWSHRTAKNPDARTSSYTKLEDLAVFKGWSVWGLFWLRRAGQVDV